MKKIYDKLYTVMAVLSSISAVVLLLLCISATICDDKNLWSDCAMVAVSAAILIASLMKDSLAKGSLPQNILLLLICFLLVGTITGYFMINLERKQCTTIVCRLCSFICMCISIILLIIDIYKEKKENEKKIEKRFSSND